MFTWEMIKELTKNPGKKFVSDPKEHFEILESHSDCGGGIHIYYEKSGDVCEYIDSQRTWQEVEQPVSFVEAVESGGRLHKIAQSGLISDDARLLFRICNEDKYKELRETILNGEFYVKE